MVSKKRAARFIKLDANGKKLSPKVTSHAAVLDTKTGLIWDAATAGPMTQAAARKHCADLRLLSKADWRLPERHELESILDLTRWAPAIDTDFFPGTKTDYYRSATAYKPDSGCAWGVGFGSGSCDDLYRGHDHFVRAVRASQSSASRRAAK